MTDRSTDAASGPAGLARSWQGAAATDLAWLVVCIALFWAAKLAGKMFQGIPGHANAFWIPSLFLAIRMVGRPGAASLTALGGGALWSLPGGNAMGVAGYAAAGVALEWIAWRRGRLEHLPWALGAGALCGLVRFGFHSVPGLLLGATPDFMLWGLGPVTGLHAGFGLVGGFIGWLALRAGGPAGPARGSPEAPPER